MNAPQKGHSNRENEGIWQRSLTTIATLKYLYSTFFSLAAGNLLLSSQDLLAVELFELF